MTATGTARTYSNRSNAARAAKAAGMLSGKFEVYEETQGRWNFRAVTVALGATVENTDAPEAPQPVPDAQKQPTPTDAKAKAKADDGAKPFPKLGTKNRILIDLVCRDGGATMEEMIAATGWKACRGTLGTLSREFALNVERRKVDGVSRYFGTMPATIPAGVAA